jgi:flagellar protein FliT
MNSTETLSMYEHIAGLTGQMAAAARNNDWDGLSRLEGKVAVHAERVSAEGVTALSGAPRLRKIDLLKQILANDREVRCVTEPWMGQLSNIMQGTAVTQ